MLPRPSVLAVGVLVLAGCGARPAPAPPSAAPGLSVTSPAFTDGGPIPVDFTCRGPGRRPALAWSGATAAAWAIVVDDPDAPGGDFYHWLVVDVPAGTAAIGDGAVPGRETPTSAGRPGWTPPCPPSGTHHYRFTVYGLRAATDLPATAGPAEAVSRLAQLAVVQGRLTGLVTHAG